ncbi:hypothetical protein ALC62_10082 [Cyphomyrmex costatus]|uniref:Uncharacterized protein n=1 Tax=Cyphomyrmex costatus TaxID=456900 RepID=A0A195CG96_9HYME|nr:hypothetical protein ALC62_10082 [Cyphomyrmex costatus]
MPDHYCFVCTSNEGIFVDITTDNRGAFVNQIKTCLSAKINESIDLSNKICYKCAYELEQCTKFVQKYENSHKVPKLEVQKSRQCCFLCCELVESDHIFDISKDKSVFNPLRKIRSIFNDGVNTKTNLLLICLTCRYNLDVLYDLKRIYQDSFINLKALINEEINYSNFPKIHTDVVNRKTTITTFPDITIYGSVNSDSESNEENMARGKRHIKERKVQRNVRRKPQSNKSKIRNCDKCRVVVANDIDMYRFYHTGLTVCKNCWITMDPSVAKPYRRSRQIQSKTKTKLCAVFLKDVLSYESHKKDETRETMKEETYITEKDKTHEIEKDNDDNALPVSSQEEIKSFEESNPLSILSKRRNHMVNGKARRGRKRKIDVGRSRIDIEFTPSKVTRVNNEQANTNEETSSIILIDAEQQSSPQLIKTRGRKRIHIDNRNSDSEEQQSSTQSTKKRGRKRINKSSDSEGSQKLSETDEIKLNQNVNKTKKKKTEETTSNARSDSSDEIIFIEEDMNLESRLSVQMGDRTSSPSTASIKKEQNTSSRTRTSSISSTEMISTEFKSPKSLLQSEIKTEYTCDKCNKKFDTKLSSAKHKLTHLKQAALKLTKITITDIKEKQEIDLILQDEVSEETTSRSSRTTSVDKRTDNPSEDTVINVENYTDDDLSNLTNTDKKMEERISNESSDKQNVTTSESRLNEESANNEKIEITESKKCKNSTVMSDDTVIEVRDDEDRQDKDVKDDHKTKDDDNTPNKGSDKFEDTNAPEITIAVLKDDKNMNENEEKDKDVEINDNLESSTENIKENIKENITEYESSKICVEESEENLPEILSTDETEALNEKNNLDDIITINEETEELEEQQNKSNEENTEVKINVDVDELNSARDMPDLLNGGTHDETEVMENNAENDVITINSNDGETNYKEGMEETISTDKNRKLEEELKQLEEFVVESNAMNNKYEDSTYVPDSSSADAATEILKEVFELATAEVQQREEIVTTKTLVDDVAIEIETLENISREIRKSADMPSLDPISVMDIDDDGIMLN